VRNFLIKLSNHITKAASFEVFAKLHSQHPSYANGGLSDWIFVNNPTIEMLDLLEDGEVSKIYATDSGWAIAIKVDERYVDSNMENCKEKIIYQKAQKFYINWLKDLRDSAYIEIYTDKL
jgi:peptidyl-prolyl cis-trans isomerase SurA